MNGLKDFEIENGVLYKYTGKEKVLVVPDTVRRISNFAFSDNNALANVTIPSSVTRIGWGAFSNCDSLSDVVVLGDLYSIGDSAFAGCTSLSHIKYRGTKSQWKSIDKGSNWDRHTGDYTVHCIDGDIKKRRVTKESFNDLSDKDSKKLFEKFYR